MGGDEVSGGVAVVGGVVMFKRMFSWVLAGLLLVLGSVTLAAPASAADSWLGSRSCTPQQRCTSTSSTSGTAGSYPSRYTVHTHNSARSTNWPLTATRTTRTFASQTGSVSVFIYTTGTLHSQSAVCNCVTFPCAV